VLAFQYTYKENERRGERERTVTYQHLVVSVATSTVTAQAQQATLEVGVADLSDDRTQHWPFRFERDDVVTWVRGEMNAGKAGRMVDYLVDVLDRVPRYT
jgi:hypothetical protein